MRGEGLDEEIRRARFYKRKLFTELPSGITVSRAGSFEDITDSLKMLSSIYVARGYISPASHGMRLRKWDVSPEMVNYIAKDGNKIVGTQEYISDSAGLGLPADETFPDEVNSLRKMGKVCEFTNYGVLEQYRSTSVTSWLMRACYAHALYTKQEFLVAEVSPSQEEFWRMNLFVKIGSIRGQKSNSKDLTIAMALNMDGCEKRTITKDKERGEKAAFLHEWWYENPFLNQVERDDEFARIGFERDKESFDKLRKLADSDEVIAA